MLSYARATARTWAEIRVEDVVNNHQAALSELAPGVRHVSVLKANAYGMGAVGTAEILYADGERLFAVACVEEALELRRALPDDAYILVMGETMPAEVAVSVSNRIASTVFRLETARALSEEAVRQGVQVHVHCKVDTGLNRLGFGTAEAAEAVQAVLRMPNLVYDGLFSHLQRRSPEHDRLQAERLWQVDRQLREAGIATPMLHMLDSIGMWRYPQYQFNAVRDGAFALGHTKLDYQHPEKLRLALSFKTRIVRIHDVPAGECCGYDADHPMTKDTRVATLCVGYADGYPRAMSEVGQVEIHGKRARVLGVVCMDLTMVDISEIPEAQVGDVATLLGGSIGIHEYAGFSQGYANEYTAMISRRVPRVYLKGGEPVKIVGYLE
ncbi:MAG: alanine racemase [Christensenellales bacterium]|mgnify:CR=1 FL=1|uniref:Alanine racemase n=1 Tax=Candidatus Avichristensenella intestinipullorum TaxID=2840693 RepID=A0A9D0YX40_9FIRM|nr:alanine racemase [Christensenellales bacterium]HIQ63707.1 alanine racemase [Candidatus Avichristensenella intestinipullorum]